ncbi:MAG: hypothetical protein P8Y85_05035 [Nitrospirota bacterium]
MDLGSGAVRHHLADALGSVTALADENGAVKTTYSYDPFGQVASSGEASDNPFQYTGRENDGMGSTTTAPATTALRSRDS